MRKMLIGALLLGLVAPAIAQQFTNQILTGTNTVITAQGGPGGQTQLTTVSQIRNARGVKLVSQVSGVVNNSNDVSTLIVTGAAAALDIVLPLKPFDGHFFIVTNGSLVSFTGARVFAGDDSSTVNFGSINTLGPGTNAEYCYVASNNTWYRLQ